MAEWITLLEMAKIKTAYQFYIGIQIGTVHSHCARWVSLTKSGKPNSHVLYISSLSISIIISSSSIESPTTSFLPAAA
jgi:hypothetical protein